ncbi:HD-GYP domain-containing protein [Clostridium magnum]|uniref:Cyclic di-GMP phosphodiesterase response regulator RpfG n=1 Tax=Clostridium magnum DSM 2767 TaxID=1121326 RepID=A0A161WZ84_9CLOT|nr:HD-GYP domain-containing protein [Clostridium magnum]KZL92438.1 cyclic di-GMP phosphodiesterase response regulator RpfG [Clostridium magnum DSM 2767]SHI26768.1 HDIG domain-containing protein [Clostridium magnum DSM 2767]
MRLVPIQYVKAGSFLAKTIYDDRGTILLREGVQLTENYIKRVVQLGMFSMYINDEYSEKNVEDIIKPELRQKAVRTIKDTFYSFEKFNLNATKNNVQDKKYITEKQNYFKAIGDIVKEIMEEMLCKKTVLINIVDIKSMDNYTYQHCVNVAVLSLALGIQLQLDKKKLYDLCLGALIHDIGKALVPEEILKKNNKLTEEETSIVREHTKRGYDFLKGSIDISATARIIALEHHEREDGKGYPDMRKDDEINELAKIVAVADVYDALTSDRPYRKAMSPNDAVEYIMANGQTQFSYDVVKAFSKCIVPYPEGTIVRLSNGEIAVVEEVYPNFVLRPKVKIINKKNAKDEAIYRDLRNELEIVINGLQYEVTDEKSL